MAELPGRAQHEAELTAALLALFHDWQERSWRAQEFAQEIAAAVAPVLQGLYAEAARNLFVRAGVVVAPEMIVDQAGTWTTPAADRLGDEIAAHTDPTNPWALGQARAATIAATETTRTISAAEAAVVVYLAAQADEKGYPRLRARWITALDGRVCDVCIPLHGQTAAVWGKMFPAGPPAHPNCRCWLDYEAVD